jgi:hypothetical protein
VFCWLRPRAYGSLAYAGARRRDDVCVSRKMGFDIHAAVAFLVPAREPSVPSRRRWYGRHGIRRPDRLSLQS